MPLPNRLRSARMNNNTPGISIDDHVGDLEKALCDIFGFTIDSDITESPFLCDNSGRITKSLLRLAAGGTVGIRFRDTTNNKEFRLVLSNTQILLQENTGTEASPTWTSRLIIPLSTGLPQLASAADPSSDNDLIRKGYADNRYPVLDQNGLIPENKIPHTLYNSIALHSSLWLQGPLVTDGNACIVGDIYSTEWEDISNTGITGWSSYTTKIIHRKRVGNLLIVRFNIEGTSNNSNTYFNVGFGGNGDTYGAVVQAKDNGTLTLAVPWHSNNNTNLWFLKHASPDTWTASGTKMIRGLSISRVNIS